MLHPDPETRVGAHQILALVLVSLKASLNACLVEETNQQSDVTSYDYDPSVLLSTKSTFHLAASLLEQLCKERYVSKKPNRAKDVNKIHHLRDGLEREPNSTHGASFREKPENMYIKVVQTSATRNLRLPFKINTCWHIYLVNVR